MIYKQKTKGVSMNRQQLEQSAIDAHRRGLSLSDFWPIVAGDVAKAEPIDARRYHRFVRRLVGLVASGDTDGMTAAGEARWEADDDQAQAVPVLVTSDTETAARCFWHPGQEDVDLAEAEAQGASTAGVVPIETGWERPATWELEAIDGAR